MPNSDHPPLKLTVEIIDRLIAFGSLEGKALDPVWDEYMELLYGDGKTHSGALHDLCVLARVALEHLNVVIVQRVQDAVAGKG